MAGRILALDVGKKRIGLAVSDGLGLTAQGLPTLHRKRIREDLGHLAAICREYEVLELLVGQPLHMSGDESRQAAYTREFAERFGHYAGLPVTYRDERWTSVQAERILRETGTTTDRRAGTVDRVAAVLLLQNYLDSGGGS